MYADLRSSSHRGLCPGQAIVRRMADDATSMEVSLPKFGMYFGI
jgi:hypothetical protein